MTVDKLFQFVPAPIRAILLPIITKALKGPADAWLKKRLDAATPKALARLEKDGHTFDTDTARWLVRAAEYQLWYHALPEVPLRSYLADAIRDAHDEDVLLVVLAKLTTTNTLAELVALTAQAEYELST